jgi:hypothetical protein
MLVGGRLMSSDDGPGALLMMYENAEDRLVVLYACQNEDGGREASSLSVSRP